MSVLFRFLALLVFVVAPLTTAAADDLPGLAGVRRIVFLGDSNTQAGGYVTFTTYYLEKLHTKKDFDVLSLGLASETHRWCRS